MPDKVTRSTIDSYFIQRPLSPETPERRSMHTWACIAVDSGRWVLQVHSDYGSWAYHWHPEEGRNFKKCLLEMHGQHPTAEAGGL